MIKKIVFDLDNTLIMNREEYLESYQEVLQKYGYEGTKEEAFKIYRYIDEVEKKTYLFSVDSLYQYFLEKKENYSKELVIDIIDSTSSWAEPASLELLQMLEYLSSKYELEVLTNWFTDCQRKRLEKAGIAFYFQRIEGGDIHPVKPHPEAYQKIFDNVLPSECLMIGDSLKVDIKGAKEVGMQTLLFDYEKKYEQEPDRVCSWKEIQERL